MVVHQEWLQGYIVEHVVHEYDFDRGSFKLFCFVRSLWLLVVLRRSLKCYCFKVRNVDNGRDKRNNGLLETFRFSQLFKALRGYEMNKLFKPFRQASFYKKVTRTIRIFMQMPVHQPPVPPEGFTHYRRMNYAALNLQSYNR